MWLARSHNPCHEFDWLTSFFNWQFFFSNFILTLGWLEIRLHNLFEFAFYEVILVHDLRRGFDGLT